MFINSDYKIEPVNEEKLLTFAEALKVVAEGGCVSHKAFCDIFSLESELVAMCENMGASDRWIIVKKL